MREERRRRYSPVEESSRRRSRYSEKQKRKLSPRLFSDQNDSKHSRKDSSKQEPSLVDIKSDAGLQPAKTVDEMELLQKECLYKAKMAIEQRMRQMNMPGANVSVVTKSEAVLRPEEASAFANLQMKQKQMEELKRSLNSRFSSVMKNATSKEEPVSTRDVKVKDSTVITKAASPELNVSSTATFDVRGTDPETLVEYLDPRLHVKSAVRQRRAALNFKTPGEYEKLANEERMKAKLERLQSEISRAAKQTGISSAVKLAIVTPSSADSNQSHVPDVEWWDEIVLGSDNGYNAIPTLDVDPEERYKETITNLVEHPIQLKPPDEPTQPIYLKACLTSKERRKLRRQNRRELLKEKMEKVRLGLEPPPEPKLKISNLMRVLGSDAVQDPTKMEAHVRKQIADRLNKHERENKERKLTREQRSEKAIRKTAEDTSLAVHVAVYKVKSLANQKKRFKVSKNAEQLQMTGIFLTLDDISVIVVEGGPKQQKFYENLMMRRIKWADEIAGERRDISQTKNDKGVRNECALIWKGLVQKRAFGDPKFVSANSHKHAREILDKYGVAHYWDLCYSTTVLLSSVE